MACENDKCEKYGMHHDYVDGVEVRKCQFCRRDDQIEGYFPPPWNINEHPKKTEGWIAFQKEQRKDPKYYGLDTLKNPPVKEG